MLPIFGLIPPPYGWRCGVVGFEWKGSGQSLARPSSVAGIHTLG